MTRTKGYETPNTEKWFEDRENFTLGINYDTLYMGFKYHSGLQKMYKISLKKNGFPQQIAKCT